MVVMVMVVMAAKRERGMTERMTGHDTFSEVSDLIIVR
jgi:hypothetical protein